jgi:hypothetical protein
VLRVNIGHQQLPQSGRSENTPARQMTGSASVRPHPFVGRF